MELDGEHIFRCTADCADPKPGTPEAVAQGCTCPVVDNCGGSGAERDGARLGWHQTFGCPLHWPGDERFDHLLDLHRAAAAA
jgi:hypothetical protein